MRAVTRTISRATRLLCISVLCLASPLASAQLLSAPPTQPPTTLTQTGTLAQTGTLTTGTLITQLLPLKVTASGNSAYIVIGNQLLPLADVSLNFDNASGLTPSSLGVTAQLLNVLDQSLLSRLPDLNLTQLTSALPLLLTIEPPTTGGLSFRNTGRLEIHTHLLPYSLGSSLRVFKAPLLGPFRDVTDEIAKGSVRARTTYGGFSQFLILVDLRNTNVVIDEKIAWLRALVGTLPTLERPPLYTYLNQADAAVDSRNYAAALTAIDAFQSRVQARAGIYIPNEWRATHTVTNQAGDLIAGTKTLRFSVTYLRDFGP